MGNSLFDQLNKTGLVNKNKAKQVKKNKHRQAKQLGNQKGKNSNAISESALRAQKLQAEKAQRDRELNQQQKQAAEQKAIAAQIKQLIEMNRIDTGAADEEAEIAFNFTHGKRIQQLHVNAAVHAQISRGRAAIVQYEKGYALVPLAVAEKIQQRESDCIVYIGTDESINKNESNEDDIYADYQVPDDLMW